MPTLPPEDFSNQTGDFAGIPEESPPAATEEQSSAVPRWLPITLGCGCLGLPLLVVVFVLSGLTSTFLRFYRSTGSYQVYQLAAEQVKQAPAVRSALGEPIETGWVSKSNEHHDGTAEGRVCQQFGVTGQQRQGNAYVEARQVQGAWQLHQLQVAVNGQADLVIVKPLDEGATSLCPDFWEEVPPEDLDEARRISTLILFGDMLQTPILSSWFGVIQVA